MHIMHRHTRVASSGARAFASTAGDKYTSNHTHWAQRSVCQSNRNIKYLHIIYQVWCK